MVQTDSEKQGGYEGFTARTTQLQADLETRQIEATAQQAEAAAATKLAANLSQVAAGEMKRMRVLCEEEANTFNQIASTGGMSIGEMTDWAFAIAHGLTTPTEENRARLKKERVLVEDILSRLQEPGTRFAVINDNRLGIGVVDVPAYLQVVTSRGLVVVRAIKDTEHHRFTGVSPAELAVGDEAIIARFKQLSTSLTYQIHEAGKDRDTRQGMDLAVHLAKAARLMTEQGLTTDNEDVMTLVLEAQEQLSFYLDTINITTSHEYRDSDYRRGMAVVVQEARHLNMDAVKAAIDALAGSIAIHGLENDEYVMDLLRTIIENQDHIPPYGEESSEDKRLRYLSAREQAVRLVREHLEHSIQGE